MPLLKVYEVNPDLSACIAASFICSGVSKSGSPSPRLKNSPEKASNAFLMPEISMVLMRDANLVISLSSILLILNETPPNKFISFYMPL